MSKTSPAQFVRQVRQELKRITWATKRDTIYATITVFFIVCCKINLEYTY